MNVITYKKMAHAKSTRTVKKKTGEISTSEFSHIETGSNGFRKPDEIVYNPKVNGYRKPSSYSCSLIGQVGRESMTQSLIVCGKLNAVASQADLPNRESRSWTVEGESVKRIPIQLPELSRDNIRMKVLNNLRSEIWDVAMTLAEVAGTANTLGSNLVRLGRSMDQVKRRKPDHFWYLLTGRRRDGRRPTDRFLRESAGAFLEWKYGIMPTIYDIQGACKGLDMAEDGSLFDNPLLLVARATDRRVITAKRQIDFGVPGGYTARVDVPYKVRSELKARVDYEVTGEMLRGLNRFGIGLGSVGTILFERTPFSFVLNMALPIAELIKAWTALAGVKVLGYCETEYHEATTDNVTVYGTIPQLGPTYIENVAEVEIEQRSAFGFDRKAYASVPMPMPFIRNPVKVGNIATALALFTTLRKPSP